MGRVSEEMQGGISHILGNNRKRESGIALNRNRECKRNVKMNVNVYRSWTKDQGVMFDNVKSN
jgi:hypothetical protein